MTVVAAGEAEMGIPLRMPQARPGKLGLGSVAPAVLSPLVSLLPSFLPPAAHRLALSGVLPAVLLMAAVLLPQPAAGSTTHRGT
jgi:hypothetical protein